MREHDLLLAVYIEIGLRDVNAIRCGVAIQLIEQRFRPDQILQDGASQMWRVKAAEQAVPVGIISLRCQQVGLCLTEQAAAFAC